MRHIVAATFLFSAASAHAGEIFERLRTEPNFKLTSTKRPEDLELCVADALTHAGAVSAFRNGRETIIMSLMGVNKYNGAVRLVPVEAGTDLTVFLRGKTYDDRMKGWISDCV